MITYKPSSTVLRTYGFGFRNPVQLKKAVYTHARAVYRVPIVHNLCIPG